MHQARKGADNLGYASSPSLEMQDHGGLFISTQGADFRGTNQAWLYAPAAFVLVWGGKRDADTAEEIQLRTGLALFLLQLSGFGSIGGAIGSSCSGFNRKRVTAALVCTKI